jgi:DNA-binding IclR family transcriptional regulator
MSRAVGTLDPNPPGFVFLTNHAHVLLLIARETDLRMRELATEVGITERAIQRIVEELTASGYLIVTKDGRRNRYQVREELSVGHRVASRRTVGELVRFVFAEG